MTPLRTVNSAHGFQPSARVGRAASQARSFLVRYSRSAPFSGHSSALRSAAAACALRPSWPSNSPRAA